jgi:hypothetical protein
MEAAQYRAARLITGCYCLSMKTLLLSVIAALALGGYARPASAAPAATVCAKKHGKKKARGKKSAPKQPQPNIPL